MQEKEPKKEDAPAEKEKTPEEIEKEKKDKLKKASSEPAFHLFGCSLRVISCNFYEGNQRGRKARSGD